MSDPKATALPKEPKITWGYTEPKTDSPHPVADQIQDMNNIINRRSGDLTDIASMLHRAGHLENWRVIITFQHGSYAVTIIPGERDRHDLPPP